MNAKTILFALFLLSAFLGASAQSVNFDNSSWADLKAKAKAENKLIFVDCYTTWCGPCKMMEKKTFTKASVAEFYNRNFINARLDMEKGEGLQIAKNYDVRCYPSYLFIDGDGKLVHRSASYRDTAEFIEVGKTSMQPEKTFSALKERFDANMMKREEVPLYLASVSGACLPANDMAVAYLVKTKESELSKRDNWLIIRDNITDINSAPFRYLLKNKEVYYKNFGKDTVGSVFRSAYTRSSFKEIEDKCDAKRLAQLQSEIKSLGFEKSEQLCVELEQSFAETNAHWDQFFAASKTMVEKYYPNSSEYLNSVSYIIYERCTEKEYLKEALQWSQKSVELGATAYNMDTYACLLSVNGMVDKAIDVEMKAIGVAKENGDDALAEELEKNLATIKTRK